MSISIELNTSGYKINCLNMLNECFAYNSAAQGNNGKASISNITPERASSELASCFNRCKSSGDAFMLSVHFDGSTYSLQEYSDANEVENIKKKLMYSYSVNGEGTPSLLVSDCAVVIQFGHGSGGGITLLQADPVNKCFYIKTPKNSGASLKDMRWSPENREDSNCNISIYPLEFKSSSSGSLTVDWQMNEIISKSPLLKNLTREQISEFMRNVDSRLANKSPVDKSWWSSLKNRVNTN